MTRPLLTFRPTNISSFSFILPHFHDHPAFLTSILIFVIVSLSSSIVHPSILCDATKTQQTNLAHPQIRKKSKFFEKKKTLTGSNLITNHISCATNDKREKKKVFFSSCAVSSRSYFSISSHLCSNDHYHLVDTGTYGKYVCSFGHK